METNSRCPICWWIAELMRVELMNSALPSIRRLEKPSRFHATLSKLLWLHWNCWWWFRRAWIESLLLPYLYNKNKMPLHLVVVQLDSAAMNLWMTLRISSDFDSADRATAIATFSSICFCRIASRLRAETGCRRVCSMTVARYGLLSHWTHDASLTVSFAKLTSVLVVWRHDSVLMIGAVISTRCHLVRWWREHHAYGAVNALPW